MKKFIINIISFIFILALLNLAVKLMLNDIYFRSYSEVELNKEVYLLADSHGEALGEFHNQNIYNFSAASDSYFDLKRKLKYLIRNSNVKSIILTADDHTLSPYRNNLNNEDRSVYFTSGEDFSNPLEFLWERYVDFNLVILNPKYGPLLKSYLKSKLRPSSLEQNSDKWSDLSEDAKKQAALKRFEKQFTYKNQSSTLRSEMREIISLCQQNNINIIGIKFPLSEVYNETIGENSFGAEEEFRKRRVNILNFNKTDSFKSQTLFKDQDHLNKRGAKLLKEALKDSISNIL